MVIVKDILLALWQAFASLVIFFADKTTEAGIAIDPLILVLLAVVLTIWLGSGAWAASIAGMRHRSGKLHFICGLLVPYLYPLFIVFAMDVKGAGRRDREREKQRRAQEEEEAEKQRIAEMLEGQGRDAFDPDAPPEPPQWDMAYFERISRDANGDPTGPWRIVYGDSEVVARRIIDVLAENVLVEVQGDSEKGQRLRIPYARIVSCDPM